MKWFFNHCNYLLTVIIWLCLGEILIGEGQFSLPISIQQKTSTSKTCSHYFHDCIDLRLAVSITVVSSLYFWPLSVNLKANREWTIHSVVLGIPHVILLSWIPYLILFLSFCCLWDPSSYSVVRWINHLILFSVISLVLFCCPWKRSSHLVVRGIDHLILLSVWSLVLFGFPEIPHLILLSMGYLISFCCLWDGLSYSVVLGIPRLILLSVGSLISFFSMGFLI